MSRMLMAVVVVCCAPAAFAQEDADARKVAETYLNALSGTGDEAGKDLLLGGVTMNAQLFILENWKIKSKDPIRKEDGDLAHAVQLMSALDKSGRTALTKLMGVESVGDDLKMTEVGPEEAAKLLAPTKERAAEFAKHHAVLSYALRVGKEVYWHPKNPMRAVLSKAGTKGKYSVEVHRWTITTVEGPSKQSRDWPLRVIRFKSQNIDTGWKILPASDWNAE